MCAFVYVCVGGEVNHVPQFFFFAVSEHPLFVHLLIAVRTSALLFCCLLDIFIWGWVEGQGLKSEITVPRSWFLSEVLQTSQVSRLWHSLKQSLVVLFFFLCALTAFHAVLFCTASLNLWEKLYRFVMNELRRLSHTWDTHTNHCCPSVLHSCGSQIFLSWL